MATTEVLLVKPIEGLGGEGEIVNVKAGFARNYLLPRGFADKATLANRKRVEALSKRRVEREAQELQDAQAVAKKLESISIAFAVKTGEGGKMYGSITNAQLAERLAEENLEVERRKIILDDTIRTLGKHSATIKLHHDVSVDFNFEVVSENPIIEAKVEDDQDDD